jgi:hypothetical protein
MSEFVQGISNIKLGYPPSNGDNWQFNVRSAEVLDAAGVEIVAGPHPEAAKAVGPETSASWKSVLRRIIEQL